MKLERELGSYGRWVQKEYISWRVQGASPDRIRDGKSGLVKSVTRTSTGLYTVALRTDRPSIVRHITAHATIATPANTAPAQAIAGVYFVEGSWDQTAGTFQVICLDDANTLANPSDGNRISVTLTGSISSVGQDAA